MKLVVCLVLLVVGLCLPVQAATTLIVDPTSPGAYNTVSAAVAAAGAGDRIEIAAYTYTENVTVTKALQIVGIPDPLTGDLPVIDGNGTRYAIGFENVVVDCSNVNVTNGFNGLLVDSDDQQVTLTGVNAYGNDWAGIFVDTAGDVTITGCSADANDYLGIFVVPTSADLLGTSYGFDAYSPAADPLLVSNGIAEILMSAAPESGTGFDTALDALSVTGVVSITETSTDGNGLIGCAAMAIGETEIIITDSSASENGNSSINSLLDVLRSGFIVVGESDTTTTLTGITASDNNGCGVMALGDIVAATDVTAENNANLGLAVVDYRNLGLIVVGVVVLQDNGLDMGVSTPDTTFDTVFSSMAATVVDATVVSEDEFVLGEGYTIYTEDVIADGPDVILSSINSNNNGYAGIGIIAPYIIASDITADENGACPTDVAGTLTGAGIVGASFVGEYSGIKAADNGGAGMAAASLALSIEDSLFTGNGADAYSDTHGSLFQTGLVTVSVVNDFSGVQSDNNIGSGILMTSVITECDGCTASNNEYGGIVAADPLSLGIGALLVHFGPNLLSGVDGISEEDRFYMDSLSSQAMQDVMSCYGNTDAFVPSAVADTGMDGISELDTISLVDLLHQYLAISECSLTDSAAENNGLFGLTAVYPNVATDRFTADNNGYDDAGWLRALAGTGIVSIYMTGDFADTSASENTGAGIVTIGVVSEYTDVIADDNGYAGIVTIDPLTLAATAAVAYFVILDDSGAEVSVTSDTTDLDMHSDIANSEVVKEIISTYYTGTTSVDNGMDAVSIPEGGIDILLEHIELYFENAGVYAYDVSASGNGYPGFVAISPNVVMDGVTADDNGALNDNESSIIPLAAGSGIIGLSIVGDYTDIAANGNSGAGIATAGVVTDMTACEADDNGVGVVSLFIVGDYTEIYADENAISGIVLAGINGTLTDSAADGNAGPGIVCVDPVAAALMYLVIPPTATASGTVGSMNGVDASFEYETDAVSPETLALLCQLSGSTDSVSSVSGDTETETKTAWTLIEWAIGHISSYEGDITDLNKTEILDLVLTHYLTNAGMSVSDVSADNNGWQGMLILSPSITVADVAAEGNDYNGVSVISPWKAVDALGWMHPAEPVGAERLSVQGISAVSNNGSGLAVAGANGGEVMDVYGSYNYVGICLGDSDQLMVSDSTFETNCVASVLCGGSQFNNLTPFGSYLPEGALTDPTGSCNNAFSYIEVDSGIVVLTNSSGNEFDDTFFDEAKLISADISGYGPFVLYSTSGYWAPVLPVPEGLANMGGCGIGVSGLGGFNTTVNITYDYSHGFPPVTGESLYPQWAVNSTTSWEDWEFNEVTNDKDAMTVGTMVVPINPSAAVPYGNVTDLMFIAPFWDEERGSECGGSVVTGNNSTSGIGASGDQQTGTDGAEAGSDNNEGSSQDPAVIPTGPEGGEGSSDVPASTTSDMTGDSGSSEMPANAGASGSGGFLPWIVLIVVVIAIAGVVYFMKYQQK